jgi:multimeric flavodoxin WrbA
MTLARELILHDLSELQAQDLIPAPRPDLTVFAALPLVKSCQGCFGCWIKTPGRCVLIDRATDLAAHLASRDRVTLVSRLVFGSLSPPVKAVVDRFIGFISPFFEYKNGRMFHQRRYPKSPSFRYFFYGPRFGTNLETAQKLAVANGLNMGAPEVQVKHFASLEDLKTELKASN